MTSPRSARRGLALLVLVGTVAALAAGCMPSAPPPVTVIFYGDSITQEAETVVASRFAQLRPGVRILVRAAGGAALCDLVGRMHEDAQEGAQLVVVQFSGNNFSCASGLTYDSPELVAKYQADAEAVETLWEGRGVPVAFMGSPRHEGAIGPSPVDSAYRAVATAHPAYASFDPAPGYATSEDVQVEDPPLSGLFRTDKTWPLTMPCLAGETSLEGCAPTAAGPPDPDRIQVRRAGDIHHCLVPAVAPCPVYSSGILRFGDAMAEAAAARFG